MTIRKLENKNGISYFVRFRYTDKYGRKKDYSKKGFKTKKEAENHENYMKNYFLQGGVESRKRTLTEVFNELMETNSTFSINTKQNYMGMFRRHVQEAIGGMDIKLIDYKVVYNLIDQLAPKYSIRTNSAVYQALNATFKYAYNCGYIDRLPYSKIKVEGLQPKQTNKVVSLDEFESLIEYIEKSERSHSLNLQSYRIALYVGYYTGMRIGEVFALDWNDIDFNLNRIRINKSIVAPVGSELVISKTKTETSNNIIPLPQILKEILLDWKEINTSEHVLVDNSFNYLTPHNLQMFLVKYSKKSNTHITFHMLRHSYSTILWENNINPKIAQNLLRHKDISTTMNVYTHLDRQNLNEVVDDLFKN